MSDDQSWPPPGSDPTPGYPPPPPPGYQPPPPGAVPPPAGGWGSPPPGYQPRPAAPAVYRPGAVPLRPLGLGDMYDASFKIIRFNAGATVGSTLLVSSVALLIPTLATIIVARFFDLSTDAFGEPMDESEVLLTFGAGAAGIVGGFFQWIGLLLVTGMVAIVTQAAAVGKRLSIAEAWALTHGRRWRLIGLSALTMTVFLVAFSLYSALWVLFIVTDVDLGLLVLFGVVSLPLGVALLVWAWVRLSYLVVPAMMLERLGVFAAIARGFRLTSGQFWRTFGIALLTAIVTAVAGQLLALPVTLLGAVAPALFEAGTAAYVSLMAQALGAILAASFVTPFAAAVSSLQYVDQRMRKEGYDVELLTEAGITPS